MKQPAFLLATYGKATHNTLTSKVGGGKVPSTPRLLSTYGSVRLNHLTAKVGAGKGIG
jgi:hypothetical protein